MTFVPFAYRSLYLKPFAMDGTTASGIVLQHHDKLAKIYGRVTAVHPSCRNVRVGDWVIFEPGRPERLSTREGAAFRDQALGLGFTAMSAGSRTNPGGYAGATESLKQFDIDDDRSPAQVAALLRRRGYDPVWKDWDSTYDAGETRALASAMPATKVHRVIAITAAV